MTENTIKPAKRKYTRKPKKINQITPEEISKSWKAEILSDLVTINDRLLRLLQQ